MRKALIVSLGLLAFACVSTKVNRLDRVVRPSNAPESVTVLLHRPDGPYEVIAVLESKVDGALKGFDDLRRDMVAQAAQLGGDALILGPESKKTRVMFVGAPVPTPIFYEEMKLTGQVIAFN